MAFVKVGLGVQEVLVLCQTRIHRISQVAQVVTLHGCTRWRRRRHRWRHRRRRHWRRRHAWRRRPLGRDDWWRPDGVIDALLGTACVKYLKDSKPIVRF